MRKSRFTETQIVKIQRRSREAVGKSWISRNWPLLLLPRLRAYKDSHQTNVTR